jgi:Kdo2-lipid IVA lauroyltransferase/acyltransferase
MSQSCAFRLRARTRTHLPKAYMASRDLRRRITQPLLKVIFKPSVWLLQHTPVGLLRLGANSLGSLAFLLMRKERRIILSNLAVAFPEKSEGERKTIGRRSLCNVLFTFLEFIWVLRTPQQVNGYAIFKDSEQDRYWDCCGRDGAAIIISPHIGNWEIGHIGMNAYGIPTSTVARENRYPPVEEMLANGRSALGAEILLEEGAAKGMLRALRKKRHLVMLVDQNTRPSEGGMFAPFFGLPVTVSRAPAMFALRTNAPVTLGCCVRNPQGQLEMRVYPLPKLPRDYGEELALTTAINEVTEAMIREHPDQYLWIYKRWRYMPDDQPELKDKYPFYSKVFVDRRHS